MDLKNWIGCSIRLLPEMARNARGLPNERKGREAMPI